jgi:hypothetical protein
MEQDVNFVLGCGDMRCRAHESVNVCNNVRGIGISCWADFAILENASLPRLLRRH